MKIRLKIVSTVLSMCLALVVMGFAVWAASTQSLPVINTVDFTSIHVLSTVSGSVSGAKADTFANYGPVSTLAGDAEGKLGSWAIGSAMEFDEEIEPIVITLTIVNNSDERSLTFELNNQSYTDFNGVNLGNTNIDRTCKFSINNSVPVENVSYISGEIAVEPLKTATIVLTLKISDTGKSVNSFNNAFNTTLRNVAKPLVGFSFNTGSGEIASVETSQPLTEENLPELSVDGQPAFYGLYSDELMTQKIQFPYTGDSLVYAKFGNPDNITLSSINSGKEYAVSKNGTPVGTVEIPEKYNWIPVTTIPNDAFKDCTGLTSVVIPSSVTTIGTNVLNGCTSLETLSAPFKFPYCNNPCNNSFLRYFFGGTSYSAGGSSVPTSLKTVIIAGGTKGIGEHAFDGCSALTSVVIPTSLTEIGAYAFSGCSLLTSFSDLSNVTTIGGSAFNATGWYSSQSDGVVYAGNVAYTYKGTMPASTEIILNSETKAIATNAFRNFANLTSITIPEGVTTIGSYCFYGSTNLTNVTIPESLVNVGSDTFFNTAWLNGKSDGVVYAGNVLLIYKGTMPIETSITITEGTKAIAGGAFYSKTNLTEISIPEGLIYIGNSAFYGCSNLTSLILPNSVTIVGTYAFASCSKLVNISLSTGLKNISESAFSQCSGLLSITIPNSVESIDYCAFLSCSSLASIIFSDNLKYIGVGAFYCCTSLVSLVFPNSLTVIDDSSFYGCSALTSVTISSEVNNIVSASFEDCVNLKTVIIDSPTIASGLTSLTAFGNLIANFTTASELYILNSISTIGSYVIDIANFASPVESEINLVIYKKFIKI
ncbi:MAG: leucine-rich repeat domain-containing protein [Clostridia bacterium]